MTKQQLLLPEPPYLLVVEADLPKITDFGWSLENHHNCRGIVRFLRGKKMTRLASLYDEFAAALQFPYYFGQNWNALDECITDLGWIMGEFYVLIITDAHLILTEETEDQWQALVTILDQAGNEWSRPGNGSDESARAAKGFHVIFQCPETGKQQVLARLESHGAEFQEIAL